MTPGLNTVGLEPWAILAGVLVDAAGSFLLGARYAVAVIGPAITEATTPVEDALTPHLITIAILGLLSTAAGGYVAGHLAKQRPIGHGMAVGVVSLLLWLVTEWVSPTASTKWYDISSFIAVPTGALGGYLADKHMATAGRPR